jgi:hypothetical protein
VLGVKIDLSSNFLGNGVSTDPFEIVRKDGAFTLDGRPVDPKLVEALAGAVSAPPFAAVTAESLGLDAQSLRTQAQSKAMVCPGASLTPVASDAFVGAYTNMPRFNETIAKYYGEPSTSRGRPTTVRVTITTDGGTVVAESTSPKAGMLPWHISAGAAVATTYNGRIPQALEALLPPPRDGTGDRAQSRYILLRLMYPEWEDLWANDVCSKDLRNLAFRSYLASTVAYANEHGLALNGFIAGEGTSIGVSLTLELARPDIITGFSADVDGGDATVLEGVRRNERTLRRFAAIPWLRAWLDVSGAKVFVQDPSLIDSPLNGAYVDELADAGFTSAANRLNVELGLPGIASFNLAQTEGQWFLLRSGDVVLVDFQPAKSKLPFSPEVNASIRVRAKPRAKTPNVLVSGIIIHPDGSIDWPQK